MFNYFLIKYIEHIIFSRNNYIDIELPNLIFTEFFFSPLSSSSSCLPLLFLLPLFFFFTLLALLFLHRSLLLSFSLSFSPSFVCILFHYHLHTKESRHLSFRESLSSFPQWYFYPPFFRKDFHILFQFFLSLFLLPRSVSHGSLSLFLHSCSVLHAHTRNNDASFTREYIHFILYRVADPSASSTFPLPSRESHIHSLSLSHSLANYRQ